jgi:hypothetical protein
MEEQGTQEFRGKRIPPLVTVPIMVVLAVPAFVMFRLAATPTFPPAVAISPRVFAVRAELRGPAATAHLATPKFVKGIYVTSSTVSSKRRFAELVDLVDRTELNTMVIDVKDSNGNLAFVTGSTQLKSHMEKKPALGDLPAFTAPLHEKGIYLIARIFVFQDPALVAARPELAVRNAAGGIWRNKNGVPWLDAASEEVWKYDAEVAKEAYDGGFDEVQFDYIRFPSDGSIHSIKYPVFDGSKPKAEVLRDFFAYLDTELRVKHGIPTSVDLFGLVMWAHASDLGIGQRLEYAIPHFSFISPMVYPSHYADGFDGFANPATEPYRVVYDNLVKGKEVFATIDAENERRKAAEPPEEEMRVASVRPWIQDFDLGAKYGADKVRAQMKASVDGGASGWLLWNARNVYTEAALSKE